MFCFVCRGEVNEEGRRVGIRKIQRTLINPLHRGLNVKMFVPCVQHAFCRICEKIYHLVIIRTLQSDARGEGSGNAKLGTQ